MKFPRKFLSVYIISVFLCSFFLPGFSVLASESEGVLIVKIKNAEAEAELRQVAESVEFLFANTYRIEVSDVQRIQDYLNQSQWVEYAHADFRMQVSRNAQDPFFVLDTEELSKQWYLPKIGIHQAWDLTTGSGSTVVAVVDTGINGRHQDLNDGRVGNGYASYCQVPSSADSGNCVVRIQSALGANINSDDNGHGTIVSGIIGAIANNNKGIAGVNWNVRLMPIKVLDSNGSGLASDVAAGIRWAADNGADIINLSIGGTGFEGLTILQDAITYAFQKNVLVVAAAGNDAAVTGGNLNNNKVYPVCADGSENTIIGVAAVDINDRKALFSNYGSDCIDISAPGTGIFVDRQTKQGIVSTYYDPQRPGEHDLYVYALGTSLAAPMVSGVAALMIDVFPDLDVRAIRDRLLSSADNIDSENGNGCGAGSCVGQIGSGRLNAAKAVEGKIAFSSGTLVKDISGQIYLIERGVKRPVSAYVFNQRFPGSVLIQTSEQELNSFPLGSAIPPVDGSLIKEPNIPTVYLVEGGERRPLSYLAFLSRDLRFENVTSIAAQEVAGYPLGTDAPIIDGFLIKTASHPAVFVVKEGKRVLLSFFVFKTRFAGRQIAILSDEQLGGYPQEIFLYPPAEGTLLKGDRQPVVYLVQDGKIHGLTLEAFQNRGFRFEDINVVSEGEISGYEEGEAILN